MSKFRSYHKYKAQDLKTLMVKLLSDPQILHYYRMK